MSPGRDINLGASPVHEDDCFTYRDEAKKVRAAKDGDYLGKLIDMKLREGILTIRMRIDEGDTARVARSIEEPRMMTVRALDWNGMILKIAELERRLADMTSAAGLAALPIYRSEGREL